jgi:uncharacterized protein YaiL (DUF2058 family)
MAKGNPLQEQLLKAGLVKKSKMAEVAREQKKARHAKGPSAPGDITQEAERARAEKTERDRALAAEHKAQARIAELRAQRARSSKTRRSRAPGRANTASPPMAPSAPCSSTTTCAGSCPPAPW